MAPFVVLVQERLVLEVLEADLAFKHWGLTQGFLQHLLVGLQRGQLQFLVRLQINNLLSVGFYYGLQVLAQPKVLLVFLRTLAKGSLAVLLREN